MSDSMMPDVALLMQGEDPIGGMLTVMPDEALMLLDERLTEEMERRGLLGGRDGD